MRRGIDFLAKVKAIDRKGREVEYTLREIWLAATYLRRKEMIEILSLDIKDLSDLEKLNLVDPCKRMLGSMVPTKIVHDGDNYVTLVYEQIGECKDEE